MQGTSHPQGKMLPSVIRCFLSPSLLMSQAQRAPEFPLSQRGPVGLSRATPHWDKPLADASTRGGRPKRSRMPTLPHTPQPQVQLGIKKSYPGRLRLRGGCCWAQQLQAKLPKSSCTGCRQRTNLCSSRYQRSTKAWIRGWSYPNTELGVS